MDSASEAKLSQVNPALADAVRQMAAILAASGITIRVVSGLRTYEQQAALYANRANNPNPVAPPGSSKHERGLAVDLTWSGGSSAQVGAVGESLGLRWGGRFSRPDPGHFELADGVTYSQPPAATQPGTTTGFAPPITVYSGDGSGDDSQNGAGVAVLLLLAALYFLS